MASPAISVLIATYNRSRALGHAIESVLKQTFTDWELIVIGDGCTDDTAEVVARYIQADPRVRFVNLERNWGEQSAPNNIGRSLARAPLIAYLSHDDLWLRHHLKACSEALAAIGADMVVGTAANIKFEGGRIAFESLKVLLQGMGEDHQWSPSDLHASFAAASSWLIRAEALDRTGGWRMSQEEHAEPSQELLFRVWRRGLRIYTLNELTLVIVGAGDRPKSYLQRETPEHDWIAEHLDDPAFAVELAARMPSTNVFADSRFPHRPPFWRRALAGILAHIGINPRALTLAMRYGWSRGAYLRHLRESMSLDTTPQPHGAAAAVRAGAVRSTCRITIGTPVDFRAGAGGARYLAAGWSYPEIDGVWSDGPSASLMFDIGSLPAANLHFVFSLAVFHNAPGVPREVLIDARGQQIHRWTLTSGGDWGVVVPVSAWTGSRLILRFRFDETKSPTDLGVSGDYRALSIKLRSVCICPV